MKYDYINDDNTDMLIIKAKHYGFEGQLQAVECYRGLYRYEGDNLYISPCDSVWYGVVVEGVDYLIPTSKRYFFGKII